MISHPGRRTGVSLVVFDMAGTTVHDDDAVNRLLRQSLARFGIQADRDEVNRVMGLPKPVAIQQLLDRPSSLSRPELVEVIHSDFVARSIAFYHDDPGVREAEGASAVFESLAGMGVAVALDTGFSRVIGQVILDRLGWSRGSLVRAMVCSDEVARGRPFPDMIEHLMHRLGVADPRRVAKVGDTPSDLEEGTRAGCGLVVGVAGPTHSRDELRRFPHTHLVEMLGELPGLLASLEEGVAQGDS